MKLEYAFALLTDNQFYHNQTTAVCDHFWYLLIAIEKIESTGPVFEGSSSLPIHILVSPRSGVDVTLQDLRTKILRRETTLST